MHDISNFLIVFTTFMEMEDSKIYMIVLEVHS